MKSDRSPSHGAPERDVTHARARLAQLQAKLDRVGGRLFSSRMQLDHLERGAFGPLSRAMRAVGRFIVGRIFGQNIGFDLVPGNDLQFSGEAFEWRSIGADPFFQMVPFDGFFPSGWVLVDTFLQQSVESDRLKLYFDAGEGMSEANAIALPVSATGDVHQLIRLPRGIVAMRWDPCEGPGELTQHPIRMSRVGAVRRFLIRYMRFRDVRTLQHPTTLKQANITFAELLFRPHRTYEAASSLLFQLAETAYHKWLWQHSLSEADGKAIRKHIDSFSYRPLISVLVPTYNTPPDLLRKTIESVQAQLYPNWELCIADDASTSAQTKQALGALSRADSRIRIEYRAANGHIAAASNTALGMAKGEFIALLDHDDLLSEHALYHVVAELNRFSDADILYSDEDKILSGEAEAGVEQRGRPHFKPDWNPDLLYSQNYISHLGVYRTSVVRAAGGFREGFEGSQDYDLVLRCAAATEGRKIRHIPAVLYHWRASPGSTALSSGEKSYATENGIRALQDHFRARHIDAVVTAGHFPTTYHARFPIPEPAPKVALIIPSRDQPQVLRVCVESVRAKTIYPNYEIVVVDNQSTQSVALDYLERIQADGIRVLRYDQPFNYAALNNFAVEQVDAEIIGLLNNDTEVINPEWLNEMVSHALRPQVGAVGAKLYYGNDTIQHAGIILGIGGVAGHGHKHFERADPGYFARLYLTQNVSAVTGACLVVRRDSYLKVGGLDSENLAIAFNDVDFCLKLREIGLRNVWTPYAELYHHESISRGAEDSAEKMQRFRKEVLYMKSRWGECLESDPCYNPMLTLLQENFRPDFRKDPLKPWLAR